jgi:hypothetical protein
LPNEHEQSAITVKIPLNRVKEKSQVCYVSAIAFKLAGQQSRKESSMTFAQEIRDCLEQLMQLKSSTSYPLKTHPLDRVWQNVTVHVTSPGWIYLKLTEQGIAEWLYILANSQMHLSSLDQSTSRVVKNTSSDLRNDFSIRDSTGKFHVLYSHARCCSLLRSASREGITFPHLPDDFESKEPIFDLLKLHHPAEQNLVSELVTTIDAINAIFFNETSLDETSLAINLAARCDPVSVWKISQALSHSFEEFYQSCRIWGEVMQSNPQLAQRRLGLVLITQKILRSLLEEALAIEAPVEL